MILQAEANTANTISTLFLEHDALAFVQSTAKNCAIAFAMLQEAIR